MNVLIIQDYGTGDLVFVPIFPNVTDNPFLSDRSIVNDKVYFAIAMILYMLRTINYKTTFQYKLDSLFNKYPDIDLAAMGFPADWKHEKFWANL
jgi:abortive infection bacteriophage resistance protein